MSIRYTAEYVAQGDIRLSGRLVLGAGADGDLTQAHALSGRLEAGAGGVGEIIPALAMGDYTSIFGSPKAYFGHIEFARTLPADTGETTLAGRMVLAIVERGDFPFRNMAGRLELGLETRGDLHGGEIPLAGRLELGLEARGEATGGSISLAGRLEIGAADRASLTLAHDLMGRLVVAVALDDSYTGPGSGLVVSGVTQDQFIAQLREGDTFHATLPFAGLEGLTGLVRVLSRQYDAQGKLTFKLQFIPPTIDAAVMRSQADSGRPRLTIDKRGNLARRLTEAEQAVNKIESNN